MLLTDSTPHVTADASAVASVDADILVLPLFSGNDALDDLPEIDEAAGGAIARAMASGAANGKAFSLHGVDVAAQTWRTKRILLVGAGSRADATADIARRVAASGAGRARHDGATRIAVVNRFGGEPATMLQAMAEGIVTACFEADGYKSRDREPTTLREGVIVERRAGEEALRAAVERGVVLGDCTNIARTLANEPGNVLPPRVFAERAVALCEPAGLQIEVLDERAIGELGMGLLLGVAQGSAEPPRLIVLRHEPVGAPAGEVLGLVGKGITFDTGGISIKPADAMDRMKDDMSGGAAVIAAMRAIALLGAPIRVIGVVPSAENMPSGTAIRPGDVLTGASGTTVEITNTDAEGRLVLGDALWYARRLGATRLVDVATLTGACVVALGKTTTGLFGSPDPWVDAVRRAADRAGDRVWPLPVFDDYREQLRSEIADIMNSGSRPAGAITAAIFLKEFVGDLPWAHLDIAGTAWSEEAKPYQPKGATGVAVRTLAELAFMADRW